MLAKVDFNELRELGWRKERRGMSYPRHPKHYELKMHLKGHKVAGIDLVPDGQLEGFAVYSPHKGFHRKDAKMALRGRDYAEVVEVMEALHDRYNLTL